jgi:hypothetical protein
MLVVMPGSVSRLDFVVRVVVQAGRIVIVESMDLETRYDCGKVGER